MLLKLFKYKLLGEKMGKSIGVLSLKGGVGKTSSVIALGDAISGFGKKVLLIDGNLTMPNIGLHLNAFYSPITLHHILARKNNPRDAIYKTGNFDFIPSSIFSNLQTNPLDLKDKIKTLKRRYDAVLIDSSPALNEETLGVMLASDEIIVLTTPDVPSLGSTVKAVKVAKKRGLPIIGIVITKTNGRDFDLSLKEVEETAGLPVLAVIPYDINVPKSTSEFTPVTSYKPNSKASKEYRKLAGALIGERVKTFNLRNFLKIPPRKDEINRELYYSRVFG